MKSLAFKHLYSLEGGYVAWKDAELPLTESPN
jgi:rhodanese-related sulfurtransferase